MSEDSTRTQLIAKVNQLGQRWELWRHEVICQRFPEHKREKVEIIVGEKFAKITLDGTSCKAFVALLDGDNKKLGDYTAGDIFMAQTWSSPAKHKRGSLFDQNPMACFNEWGPKYLR